MRGTFFTNKNSYNKSPITKQELKKRLHLLSCVRISMVLRKKRGRISMGHEDYLNY